MASAAVLAYLTEGRLEAFKVFRVSGYGSR
ncbi:hypothetical protein PMI41_03442, partial [Phyllobacterium sp. YR531]